MKSREREQRARESEEGKVEGSRKREKLRRGLSEERPAE